MKFPAPVFLPRRDWVYRLQRIAPWGTLAYGVPGPEPGEAPWFNSINATVETVLYWYSYSDFEQYAHIDYFHSITDLIERLLRATAEPEWRAVRAQAMADFARKMAAAAVDVYAQRVVAIMNA